MGLFWQFYGTCSICLLSLIMGLMFAWPSSTIQMFTSETNTTLSRVMTSTELALFGSLSSVGSLIGTPIFGYFLDKIGRKNSAIVAGFSYVIAWSIIAACKQVEVILTSVFISGFGGSVFLIAPVYISEICQDSIRGALTSGTVIFYGLGVLFSYILGGHMSYYGNIYTQLTLSVVYILLVTVLKDSPLYLLQKGFEESAKRSIAFYRSLDPNSKEVNEEMHNIQRYMNPDDGSEPINLTSEEELKLNNENKPQTTRVKLPPWRFLIRSSSTKRALFVALVLVTTTIFMGLVCVQVYAEPIFLELVPNLSANLCSIIFAVVSIIANVIAAYLTDFSGRKVLIIYSALASGVSTLLLGTQVQFKWGPDAVTAVLIYLFCVAFSMGSGTVPYVLVAELFLPEVKSLCSMLVIEWVWLINFVLLFVFNPLVDAIGLGPIFYIFSGICFATVVFSVFFQPETKGLPVDVIQKLFTKDRRRFSVIYKR